MIYEQKSGVLHSADDTIMATGYSGFGIHKNDPGSQRLYDLGPIPQGTYTVKGPPFDSPSHGPYVLHLVPDDATRKFILSLGRNPDTFLCHGDSIDHPGDASQGCVIMPRPVREQMWNNVATDPTFVVVSGEVAPDVTGEISV